MLERVKERKKMLSVAKNNMEINYEEGEIYMEWLWNGWLKH